MTKSEELAKLLGIEPAMTYSDFRDLPYPKRYDREIYPDFTEPSNFVKLLEIVFWTGDIQFYNSQQGIKCALFGDTGYFETEQLQIKDLLINALINQLKGSFLLDCVKTVIKDKVQQTEWEY